MVGSTGGAKMPSFRKKPVVIEAFQLTDFAQDNNRDWPEWLNRAWNASRDDVGAFWVNINEGTHAREYWIRTLEGPLRVSSYDWIIQGVQGELYPCKPDIFAETYEAA